MSRLIANAANEMLEGTNSSVMGQFYGTDGEVPGIVVLGSLNAMPNPDLTDTDARGRLRAWDQYAPPAPDSWNVYMRRTARIDASGNDVVLQNPVPMLRQNTSVLRTNQHTYEQDHQLLTNKSLPDLGMDELTDLAPPTETPRVDKIDSDGFGGYPAGSYWVSYFGIIGNNPMTTSRITNCAPAIQLTGVLQGQSIVYFMPDEVPDSWTGVGFCAGLTSTTMRVQKRVDVRGKVETQVVDRGPYRRDSRTITTTENATQMADFKDFGAPIAWRAHDGATLHKGDYLLSYKLLTKQGPTASQDINTVSVASDHKGEALAWAPPKAILKKEGIYAWVPEFRAHDGDWYTFDDARGNGYSLKREARIHTKYTDKDHWKAKNGPVKQPRSEKDRSGTPGPTDPMETPLAQGSERMLSGTYAVRLTTANQALGMESRPSPRAIVKLRDAGLASGGAASGVTDQSVRVMRPMPQTIRNSRLGEVDPVTGEPNLHWEKVTNSNVTVTDGDGFIQVASTSTFTGGALTLRRTAPEPLDASLNRYYAFRFRMNITSQNATTGGIVRVALRFLDSSKAQISLATLEDFRGVQDVRAYRTAGPVDGTAHVDVPAGTKYVQAIVQLVGAASDTPTVNFTMSNIGMWIGRSAPRKVNDLTLAEDTPGRDVWPVPDEQADTPASPTTAQIPYAPGPYVRTITNPNDPAKHMSPGTYIEQKGFEDGDPTSAGLGGSGVWHEEETGNGIFQAGAAFAIRGKGGGLSAIPTGLTSNITSGSWGGYIWKDFSNAGRTTFGAQAAFRIKTLPTTGNVTILGVMKSATTASTEYLARFQINSAGVLQYRYWSGSEQSATTTGVTLQPGDDVRLEMSFLGLRGAAGQVKFDVKRNDRAPISSLTFPGLAWGTLGTTQRVMVGLQNGSLAGSVGRVLIDRIKITVAGVGETTTSILGNVAQYWAPEGQPAHDPDHFITGARWPVKPGEARTFSFYGRYLGVTTPRDGASLFNLASFNADGQPIKDHGYVVEGLLGRDYWNRYSLSYTTASEADDGEDAAYVQVVRNEVGDGLLEVMGFQDELTVAGSPVAFTNTNDNDGSFQVVFDTAIKGGPLAGDTSFTKGFLRARAVSTIDSTFGQTVTETIRAGNSKPLSGSFVSATDVNVQALASTNRYVEVKVELHSDDDTKSPEVRAVFVDAERKQPILLMEDGRDFNGGILAYQLTPASFRPNVVRKEFADGSVGQEYVGRDRPPKVLKLALEALTALGKEQAEKNAASDEPHFQVEANGTRYTVAMAPEFTGSQELARDGTSYYDYTVDGIEADVVLEDDL